MGVSTRAVSDALAASALKNAWLGQVFRQIGVSAVEHIALRVDEGDRQCQFRRQHAVEQALAAREFIQAQAAVRFLVFELEQLRGVVRLAQSETGMVGQGARQRLADGHGVAHGAGALLAHLVKDGRPQRQQQDEREQGHQAETVQAAGKALQGSCYRYHGRLQARVMEKGRGGVARMIADSAALRVTLLPPLPSSVRGLSLGLFCVKSNIRGAAHAKKSTPAAIRAGGVAEKVQLRLHPH